jgi:circadian clock protein KaiB
VADQETEPGISPRSDGRASGGSATAAYELAHGGAPSAAIELVLYLAGSAPRSLRALTTVKKLCQQYLPGCHVLEIVDIYQQPALAEEAGVLAVPLLLKKKPPPEQKFVGDMSNVEAILQGLNLPPPGLGSRPGEVSP